MVESKSQQYVFSHQAIPELFHADPRGFLAYLNRDKMSFLNFWWENVGKNIGETHKILSEGLDFSIQEIIHGIILTMITLPNPTKSKEAYYIALVLPKEKEGLLLRRDVTRIFLLEYRLEAQSEFEPVTEHFPETRLVEITQRLRRIDLQKGPEANLEAFTKAVLQLIEKFKIK
jgi:hypothetical protein